MLQTLLFCSCLLVLSACGTKRTITYFEPQPTLGVEIQGDKPSFVVQVSINDDLFVSLNLNGDYLDVGFELSEGIELEFIEKSFVFEAKDRSFSVPIDIIQANDFVEGEDSPRKFGPSDKLIGASNVKLYGGGVGNRPFLIVMQIREHIRPVFNLNVPNFKLNGQLIKVPPITYKRNTGSFYVSSGPW